MGHRSLFHMAILTIAYFVAAKVGLSLAEVHPSATAVWPPTGIALTAFILLGYRFWPGIFLGAFLANLTTAGDVWTSLGIALGNTLEGLVGAFLVLRFAGGRQVFETPKGVILFTVLAGLLSTTISATLGVTSLVWGGYAEAGHFFAIWRTWWLGDANGAIMVAPVLMLWSVGSEYRWSRHKIIEVSALFVALIVFSVLVFFAKLSAHGYPLTVLCIVPLVWLSFRFDQRIVATAALIQSVIAIAGTVGGHGPFALLSTNEALLLLEFFVGMSSVTALAFTSAVNLALRERQEVLKTKAGFIATVSHELRTPLAVIKEGLDLLLDEAVGPVSPEQKDHLQITKRNVDRLARLINSVLDYQKMAGGDLHFQFSANAINDLIDEAVEGFVLFAQKNGLELVVEKGKGSPNVQCDRDKIVQVLENLLNNAIQYSSHGKIVVRQGVENGEVRIEVCDEGVGIHKEDHSKLFHVFTQVPVGGERRLGGTGLGLAISKKIIEGHHGHIGFQSAFGKGSTFYFTLPLKSGAGGK